MTDGGDKVLKVADVARMLRVGRSTVYALVKRRLIGHWSVGGGRKKRSLRFLRSDVEAYIRSTAAGPGYGPEHSRHELPGP